MKTEPQSAEVVWSLNLDKKTNLEPSTESAEKFCGIDVPCHDKQRSGMHSQVKSFSKKGLLSLQIFSVGTYECLKVVIQMSFFYINP